MSFDITDIVFGLFILATPVAAFSLVGRSKIAPPRAFLVMVLANVVFAAAITLVNSLDCNLPGIWLMGLRTGFTIGMISGLLLGLLSAWQVHALKRRWPTPCPPTEQRSVLFLACVCLLPWLWALCGFFFQPYEGVFDELAIGMPCAEVEALLGLPSDKPSDEEAKRFSRKTFWDSWQDGGDLDPAISKSYWFDGHQCVICVAYKDGKVFRARLHDGPNEERRLVSSSDGTPSRSRPSW